MRRATATDPGAVLALLHRTADAVATALGATEDWGLAGTVAGQYRSDLVADAAALAVLDEAGVGVLSEESGRRAEPSDVSGVVVVVDPLDGSTNAHRGVPWYATSLCAVDAAGPLAAVVADLVHGTRYEAVRGGGACRDGVAIAPSGCERIDEAFLGLSGWPPQRFGWSQFRSFGASALDLCGVAAGVLDGFVDCGVDAHGPWDYLGALLVCQEAGAAMVDGLGRDLVVLDHGARRTPVAAATSALLDAVLAARRSFV
jgi:fructose-1,6-bisphosphatase/inositol monophosphatase family enzyme